MNPLLGNLVSTESLYYVDATGHILQLWDRPTGIGHNSPSYLLVVWLVPGFASSVGKPVFHRYYMIGGYPALFSVEYIAVIVGSRRRMKPSATASRSNAVVVITQADGSTCPAVRQRCEGGGLG